MKKLKLKLLQPGAGEIMSRAQLKHIFGGDAGSGSGMDGRCSATAICPGDRTISCEGVVNCGASDYKWVVCDRTGLGDLQKTWC